MVLFGAGIFCFLVHLQSSIDIISHWTWHPRKG